LCPHDILAYKGNVAYSREEKPDIFGIVKVVYYNEFNRGIGSSRKEKEDVLGNTKTIFYDKYGREVKSISEKKEFIDNKNREKDNIEFDYFDVAAE
jgi:hypothetical protein